MHDPGEWRPDMRFIGTVEMRGCRPVLVDENGHEVAMLNPAIDELVRRIAQRENRENRESN